LSVYASENTDAAKRIADTLLNLGLAMSGWTKRNFKAGDDWSDRIEEAIDSCDFLLAVLSQEADARRKGVFGRNGKPP